MTASLSTVLGTLLMLAMVTPDAAVHKSIAGANPIALQGLAAKDR
jgi:hypothetical protein